MFGSSSTIRIRAGIGSPSGGAGLGRRRNDDGKLRTAARKVGASDVPAFCRHEATGNRQAHAGAGGVGPRPPTAIEALEHTIDLFRIETGSLVAHGEVQAVGVHVA